MKKSSLFLACYIGLMLFASCKKDVQPTISVVTGPEYVSPNATVYSGNPLLVGFDVTGENLVQVMLTAEQNGASLFTHSETIDNAATYSYTKTFTINAIGTVTIRGTVTDAKGNTASKSFEVSFNEKPNAKFVGHYEGNLLVNGVITYNTESMTLENEPVPTSINIVAGEAIDEVEASITFNGQTSTVHGTVEGNRVLFEAINDTFTYNYNFQGINIPIPLNMTYTVNGTLNGNQLNLDGTCRGNGSFITNTIELDGTLSGTLDKIL